MTPKFIKSNIKLTVGMLVSNHKQYIRKAMEALKPLLDAVPSELIVIDTMGENGDGSIDIVREYTDKIYPFTWCNDFSAARNEYMKRAKGEWFLYQDDDEWFDDVQEFIDFFQNGECEKYHAGFYQTRDYLTEGGYSEGVAGRMVRRTATTRFVGRVHETFNEVYGPNKEFSCFTHHYGYVYASKEDTLKKQKRNLDLIKLEIAEGGLTPRWAAQYVLELTGEEDTREEAYQKAMEFIPQLYKMGEIQDSCSQWILTVSVRHFSGKETYQQLLEQAEYILKNYPLSQTAELVLASTVVVTAAEVEDFETVLQYVELYLKNYDWRQKHESEAMIQVQLDFPGFVKESFHHQILHFAAKAANALEDFDRANEYWKRMPWKQEDFNGKYYEKDLGITIRGMRAAKDAQYDAKVESLLPLVQILAEAAEQVKQEFLAGNAATAKQYLVGMQEAAISLGTSLDSLIGEGSTTVRLLEQYCELLWNCNNTERTEEGLALAEVLYEATNLIQDSFWKEARRKQLILLLPKRGSEWPLFEPYWQEAKQNGDKVVVIPVPCYEKHYNGMRGEVIYGEEKYPENVEITDYKSYNYNDKLADLMVVMEDYNDQQKFYSVHPFFYIDNLGQYTKKIEIVSEWDGGIGELERQIEELKQMVEDAKKSR